MSPSPTSPGPSVSVAGRELPIGGLSELNFVPDVNMTLTARKVPGAERVDLVFTAPMVLVFTNQTTVAIGAWLRPFQSPVGTVTLGPKLPVACTLVECVSWKNNVAGVATFDVQAGATLMHRHSIALASETEVEAGLSVDFAAGSVVNVVMTAALTGGGGIILTFRRKMV